MAYTTTILKESRHVKNCLNIYIYYCRFRYDDAASFEYIFVMDRDDAKEFLENGLVISTFAYMNYNLIILSRLKSDTPAKGASSRWTSNCRI